jgi:NhaP-type Na+/H+ or K+/H+ antiporter
VTSSQIFIGIGLTFGLAIACQVTATTFRIPAIVLLLPVGFVAGTITNTVNPDKLFGSAFTPMVGLAVAIILFDGGLDLKFGELEGHHRRVVRRLLGLGIPLTWAGAGLFAGLLLGLSSKAAVMLGAILIVSGPTVVAPILALARPRSHLRSILYWEGTSIDPIGAIIGVLVFQGIKSHVGYHPGIELVRFLGNISIGLLGAAAGTAVLWLLLRKLKLSGTLATEVILATVLVVAAACNAFRDETGLIAAIALGVAMANLPGMGEPEDRPFFQTSVQLVIGLLFISISATVTPASLKGVVGPTVALVALLVVVVRPAVAAVATARSRLTLRERAFVGMMDPRGIVAASTAATFAAPLVALKIGGADKLLPATFIVIVLTVLVYGLSAVPAVRALGLTEGDSESRR